jgi:hypothetical protein
VPAVSSAGETGILRKVPQGGAVEALVIVDGAIADEPHLRHARDGLDVDAGSTLGSLRFHYCYVHMSRMPGRMPVGWGRASAPLCVMEVAMSTLPLSTHVAALETRSRFERRTLDSLFRKVTCQ